MSATSTVETGRTESRSPRSMSFRSEVRSTEIATKLVTRMDSARSRPVSTMSCERSDAERHREDRVCIPGPGQWFLCWERRR